MANIHIEIRTVRRAAGQRATGAAAYRAGERIRDERTGKLHNYSRRQDVTHKEIFLPSNLGEAPLEWARDRASLWNAAELAEKRGNSRVAREFQVSLPAELSPPQRLALARGFAREISDRYGIAVDLAIHDPKPGGDPRNFHAHLLATTREVTAWGLGDKAGLDMHALQRAKQGLSDHSEEYTAVRERWASHMNEAFREANIDLRVDHRTLVAQGIDRQPMVYVPMEFYRTQIKGLKPGQLERLREDYRARIAARRELAKQPVSVKEPVASLERTIDKQPMTVKEAIASLSDEIDKRPAPMKEPIAPSEKAIDPRNVEEIRKNAVQSWLRMRAKEAESSLGKGAGSEDGQQRLGETLSGERGPDDQRLQGDRSGGETLSRDTDRGQHAERDGDQTHGQVGPSEQDRNFDRVGAGDHDRDHKHDPDRDHSRDRGHDHDRDGDSAASSGYDDDASM
jgi:MobA/MobL family